MARNNRAGAGSAGPRRRKAASDLEAIDGLNGRISAIEAQQKDPARRSLFLDGSYALSLSAETVALCRLKVGMQVDGAVLAKAVRQDLYARARNEALVLLGAMARTRRQLERKLLAAYPGDEVERVIADLERNGWLDDEAYSRSFVRSHADRGERRLLSDLVRKGVPREVAMAAVRSELAGTDQVEAAREAAARRLRSMRNADRETARRRLAGYLGRRGYDFEVIARALEPLLKGLPAGQRRQGLRRSRFGEE